MTSHHALDQNPFSTPGGLYRDSEKKVSRLVTQDAAKDSAMRTSESGSMSGSMSVRSWENNSFSPTSTTIASGGRGRVPVRDFRGTIPPPSWARDKDYSACVACQTEFTLFLRRHHCRGCGLIFCHKCTPKPKMFLPLSWHMSEAERVCRTCAGQLRPLQAALGVKG